MLASIPAMVLAGRVADRWGRRGLLVISGVLMAVSFAGFVLAGDRASFLVVLILWCVTSGVYDVGINAFAVDLEQTSGRRVLAPLHAAFSAGGAVGALTSGALVAAGVDYLPLVLVGVAALAFFSEGAMEDWSGVYLRQTLALPALLGASGVAVYHASMAVGRLMVARAVERFGNRRTLLAAGLLQAGGMEFVLATREPLLVIAGFLVVGLALSAATPIAFSIAGDIAAPGRAGGASSVVATLGYNGFLVGPAAVGGLAELSGLRLSLWTVALAGLLIVILAGRLELRRLPEKGVPLEVAPVPSIAAPIPDFWFRTRSNGSIHGKYGRLHDGLRQAHRPIPPPDRTRPALRREGEERTTFAGSKLGGHAPRSPRGRAGAKVPRATEPPISRGVRPVA